MAAGYHDFIAGEGLTAANLEDYCQNQSIMRFANAAARDSALTTVKTEGMFAYLVDTNTVTVYSGSAWSTVGPVHGAATSYTPTVTQSGSVSLTAGNSEYFRVGRLITWRFALAITGTGTGANDVSITVPVTASYGGEICGVGYITDTSAVSRYPGVAVLTSTTVIKIQSVSSTGSSSYLGSNTFTAALASGDIIAGSISYTAAADA